MLVWKAIPSITPTISAIWRELPLMAFIVSTMRPTASPPLSAAWLASWASRLACTALSALCLTVALSCSMAAAVSSSADACCSVRTDSSLLPCAICIEALAMLSLLVRTWATMPERLTHMRRIAAITLASSPTATGTSTAKLPAATAVAIAAAWAGSPPAADHTVRCAQRPSPSSTTADNANTAHWATRRLRCIVASESIAESAKAVDTFTVSSTPARCARYAALAVFSAAWAPAASPLASAAITACEAAMKRVPASCCLPSNWASRP